MRFKEIERVYTLREDFNTQEKRARSRPPLDRHFYYARYERVQKLLDRFARKATRVLDMGCGFGRNTLYIRHILAASGGRAGPGQFETRGGLAGGAGKIVNQRHQLCLRGRRPAALSPGELRLHIADGNSGTPHPTGRRVWLPAVNCSATGGS